ncbi:glutamate-5-semialdehyde dehydrogenase [Enterovibrio sp. ZSDZ35]|uniref:Gamma-glutamyl phosphate reductase n=1 Tax=Enterovibrio qingdaonensis TaxID=2899818 RepID=A0ABT5QIQ6_9GAMM|nr:glutamate-5-semialdehyde dehydrogenase [Enterovibrio sp. ZSDZ35]MDD1780181.1 glutamate-5-semialdehyde dehydrogenase [Enterovibrio sp. ZSDZ35]
MTNTETTAHYFEMLETIGSDAKSASKLLAQAEPEVVNATLRSIASGIRSRVDEIITANQADMDAAKASGMSSAILDRLFLDQARLNALADSVEAIVEIESPIGKTLWQNERPNGLNILRVACPIGVLGMIYESRPNVTVDAAALCLKSHNAVVLRCGSDCFNSSLMLSKVIQDALVSNGLPAACVTVIPTKSRDAVTAMLSMDKYIDIIIPRGGYRLIEKVANEAKMPVLSHLDGICHTYIDSDCDTKMALDIVLNAKLRRTGICGAMETLLFDKSCDNTLVQTILSALIENGCELVGDEDLVKLNPSLGAATVADWTTEYLDKKLSCKFVDGVHGAIDHINKFGSGHTDCIVTNDADVATCFLNQVDSSIVMHNTSSQFADGGEFGMGAEIGISTGKIHARGPVGVDQLCTYKYHVIGSGQVRP